jgi:hypothetical protein
MRRRILNDVLRLYRRSWWRLGAVVAIVAAGLALAVWALARLTAFVASHARGVLLTHGHLKASGANAFAIGLALAVAVVCIPVALAAMAAVVRITDDTLAGKQPKVWRSVSYGFRRMPHLLFGGFLAFIVLVGLVVLAPVLSALGLLGLLLTWPARLLGRRWHRVVRRWPSVRDLVVLAVPLGAAFVWLTRTVLLVPAATLEPDYSFAGFRRRPRTTGRSGRAILILFASVLVVVVGEALVTWICFLVASRDGRIIGQALAQFVLLALPIVVLTVMYRRGWSGRSGEPNAPDEMPMNPYGVGTPPLPTAFLAPSGASMMSPWRLRHRRMAFGLPIVLITSLVGLAAPANADEGGGTTPGGSITLTVNSNADDTDPGTLATEAANCAAASGTCTLRSAVAEAVLLSGGGVDGAITVNFSSSMTIDVSSAGAIAFDNSSDNSFDGQLDIDGSGHVIVLDGGGSNQLLELFSHTWNFSLEGVELANGAVSDVNNDDGGALFIGGNGTGTVEKDTFSNDSATNAGGAIYSVGPLLVENSTFAGDTGGTVPNPEDSPSGGADIYEVSSVLTVDSDTFFQSNGGSLYDLASAGATTSVNNSFFVENSAGGFDCIESAADGFSGVDNVTYTGTSPGDTTCPGSILAPPGSPTVSTLQSVNTTSPPLLPLAPSVPNGLANAAIGAAGNDGVACPGTDERGRARPSTACDAGSFEYNPTTQVTISSTENPSVFGDSVDLTALVTLVTDVGVPKGTVQFSLDGTPSGRPVTVDGNGDAVLSTSTLSAGTHSVTAAFTSAETSAYSDSATTTGFEQTVDASGSSVILSSSKNPAPAGTSVTYSIAVTGSTNIPTGTVTLSDTSTDPATVVQAGVALDGNGKASITSSALSAGQHELVARYSGDANDAPGTSPVLAQDILASSTVSISPSSATAEFGVPETFTVSVPASANGVIPTGTVQIGYPSATVEQFANVTLSGGSGLLTLSALPVGSADDVTATYEGDTTYASSASASTSVDVEAASSATSLTVSPSGSVAYGVPVLLTATVSDTTPDSAADPDGSVTFTTSGGAIGTATLTGNGNGSSTASLSTTAGQLPESSTGLEITALYAGSNDFGFSMSTSQTLIVTQASTAVTLGSSANPSVFGQSVVLTATPSATGGSVAVPTGAVTFSDGSTALGTVTVSSGSASLTVSALAVATHQITAAFTGSGPFGNSASSALSQVVSASPSATSLSVTPVGTSRFGTTLDLTISVMAAGNGSGTPDGTVIVTDNGTQIDSLTLTGGAASFSIPSAFAATHTFVATYEGSTDFQTSNGSAIYTISPAATTSSLRVSPASSTFGDLVSITDTVTNTSTDVAPTGTVTFSTPGVALGSVSLVASGATTSTAVLTTTALPESFFDPGQQLVITAVYDGDPNFDGGTTSMDCAVAQGTTSVALQADQSTVGVPTTLTATISVATGAGTPTGSVLFTDNESAGGARNLGTVPVANGQAVLTGILFPLGTDTVTATYTSGDANFVAGPPAVLPLMVGQGSLTLGVTVHASTLTYGSPDSLSATLSGANTLAPTGLITFTATGPGVSVTLGSIPLSENAPFVATLSPSTTPIPVGATSITATYSGDANYGGISSSIESPDIVPASTVTTVTGSPNPSEVNEAIIYTATVADPSTGAIPQGSVAFSIGAVTLGSVTVDGSGQASIATTPGVTGSLTVNAVFTPNADFSGSSGSVVQVVNVLPTTVSLRVNQQALTENQNATFTAMVEPTNVAAQFARAAPTGSVVVSDGQGHGCTITLGPDAQDSVDSFGTCQASWPSGGQFTAVGTYAGDSSFSSDVSNGVAILIGQQTPLLSLTSPSATWIAGVPVTLDWSVVGPTSDDGTITISDNGTQICSSVQLVGSCSATFVRGAANLVLAYSGDASWVAGTTTLSQTVLGCVPFTPPTVSPAGAGTVSVVTASNCGGGTGYIEGTQIVLEETAAPDYSFQEWADTGSTLAVESITAVSPGPTSDEAIYNPICTTVTLTVHDADVSGGSITPSQGPNCGPGPHTWQDTVSGMSGSFALGTVLMLTPVAPRAEADGATDIFYDWSGGVTAAQTLTPTITVTVTPNLAVQANFGVTCFHGISFPAPANATATISATNCSDPSGPGYAQDSNITVTTKALGLQYFVGWSSGVANTLASPSGSTGVLQVTRGDVTIHAFYASCVSFNVVASGISPDGVTPLGSVSDSPAGTCPTQGAGWYTPGSTVYITATAASFAFGIFDGWTGGPTVLGNDVDGSVSAPNQVVVESNETETATFFYGAGCDSFSTQAIPPGSLTISTMITPGGFSCPAGQYDTLATPSGDPITLTATPTRGQPVVGWTGTTAEVDDSQASAENPDGVVVPVTITGSNSPVFSATVLGPTAMQAWACEAINPTVTLISPNGTRHTGPAPSDVSFIDAVPAPNCPLGALDYTEGSSVQLSADGPSAGYTFVGWGGVATGTSQKSNTFTLDGSATGVGVNATYQVVCYKLTSNYSAGVAASPAPNCPDEPASADEYVGGSIVTLGETTPSGYNFDGWQGTNQTAASNDGSGYTYVIMTGDSTVTADFEAKSIAQDISDGVDTVTQSIAIAAKKAVGVVAAVVGGVALGLNPVTGVVGVVDLVGLGVVSLLKDAGVSGAGLDGLNNGLTDVAQTLSFAISDLTCATVWSANANGDNGADNALGQVGNVASSTIQAQDATETYDQDVHDAAVDYEINGADAEELSTTDQVVGLAGKYGSRLGVVGAVAAGIYTEVSTGGPNTGWDSSASAAWTGGADVYDSCINSSLPSYMPTPS